MKKRLFGAVFTILVLGLSVVAGIKIYMNHKSSQYRGTAVPYLKKVVPEISKWDTEIIKEYMPPESLKGTSEERVSKIVESLSRLGDLKKFEEPDFAGETIIASSGIEKKIVAYEIDAEYEKGDAVITIGLIDRGHSFQINNFNINSPVLSE